MSENTEEQYNKPITPESDQPAMPAGKDNERLHQHIWQGVKDMCYIWAKEMRSTVTDEGVLIFFLLVPCL